MSSASIPKASPLPAPWLSRRRWLLLVLFVLFGIAMAALIGEAALRVGGYSPVYVNPLSAFHEAHPLIGYRGRPNFTGRFRRPDFDVVIAHDEKGFRKPLNPNPPGKVRHRVLVFGDSFTWGWGVGQGKVFTDRMSELMSDHRVLNFGLNGAGTVQQFALFETYGKGLLEPGDTLVLMFNGNDFVDNLKKGYLRAEVRDGQVRRVGPSRQLRSKSGTYWKEASYLFNFLVFAGQIVKETVGHRHAEKWSKKLLRLDDHSREVIVARHFMVEFQKAAAEKQASFIAAYIPQQAELGESIEPTETSTKNVRALRQAFFACAGALGLRTLDLLPYFLNGKKSGRYERFTFPHDRHWNENGHAVAAEAIHSLIVEEGKGRPEHGLASRR